jgi:hypothetical protein
VRVILHIGTEKTGTSTIQRFLNLNRAALHELGILVPVSCFFPRYSANHYELPVFAQRDDTEDNLRTSLDIKSLAQFRENLLHNLPRTCHDSGCNTVVFSSEHCSSRLLFDEEIERLKEILLKIGTIEIIIYLRRQDQLWVSRYSNQIKNNSTKPITYPGRRARDTLLNYKAICVRWAKTFGHNNMRVRIFDRRAFIGSNLISDFVCSSKLSIDLPSLVIPAPQNIGLDPRLLEFLRRLNSYLPNILSESGYGRDPLRRDSLQKNLVSLLEKLSKGDRLALPIAWKQALLEECAAGNEYVARTFLGKDDGRLFPEDESEEYPRGGSSEFTIDDAFEIFARIWAEYHQHGSGPSIAAKRPDQIA